MGKFIESTLRCMIYFFLSWLAGKFVSDVFTIVIESTTPPGTIRSLLRIASVMLFVCIFLYIIMHRTGHKGNITKFTEKKPLKEVLISIIIAVLLVQVIPLLQEIQFIINLPPEHYLYVSQDKNEVFVSLLPRFILQSIVYIILMSVAYNSGYKKLEKDRNKMMLNKMII